MERGASGRPTWQPDDEPAGHAAARGIQELLGQDAPGVRVVRAAPALLEPRLAAQLAQHSSV
jgi:hypothetical protein